MVTITFNIDEVDKELLDKVAEKEGNTTGHSVSRSDLIRQAIKEYIALIKKEIKK